jgi:hypothetical protein
MIKKSKTQFWVIVDRRIDNLLRREAMQKGLSKCSLIRHIVNDYYIKQGHDINDLIKESI